jgi:predicted dehydrogenase
VTDSLSAAVVGTSFGARLHVPALRAAGIEVRALVGRDPARTRARAEALGIPIATTSLDEVLADDSIACVTVATPPDAHTDVVLSAVGAGRHELSEKPFASGASEARAMADAVAAAGVVGVVGCEFRWVPEEELARRAIAGGAIGTPQLATYIQHSRLLVDGLHGAFNDEWWFDRSRGGGILGGGGIHYIDRFRTWLGEVVAVSAFLQVVGDRPADEAEDTYTITLRFASGCVGTIQHCAATHADPLRVCRIVGSAGTVSFDGGDLTVHDAAGARSIPTPDDLRLPDAPPPSDDVKHSFTGIELPPYTRLTERFRDEVLGRPASDEGPPTPTFEDAWRGQLVLDAVRASSREGGRWMEVAASARHRA